MSDIIYLACPYTHPSPAVRLQRFQMSAIAAAWLIVRRNKIVYSPITSSHPVNLVMIESKVEMPTELWLKYDEAFMQNCSECIVLKIEGWDISTGVKFEMEFFKQAGKPVSFLTPNEIFTDLILC